MADRAQENLQLLEKCFAIIGRGDAEALVQNYTTDYVLELPYSSPLDMVRVAGRDAVKEFLAGAFQIVRFDLKIDEVHANPDPDLIIAEYHSQGRALTTGKPYANRYVGFWWFRGNRVCKTREYVNPLALTEAGVSADEFE